MSEQVQNLDALCARHGWKMAGDAIAAFDNDKKAAEKAENLVAQTLAVLQEQGVYAFFLFLQSRKGKPSAAAGHLGGAAQHMLSELKVKPFDAIQPNDIDQSDALRAVRETLAEDLDGLLLVKRALEQALIYARYHAKASGGNG